MKRIFFVFTVCCAIDLSAEPAKIRYEFPKNFKWCVATAAHQIEGHNVDSDWWVWEHTNGKIRNGETSDPGDDHWNHLSEDTKLLQELHVGAYRFSIEWAKIEPQPGQWNAEAIQHYKTELDLLKRAGIEPMVTLQHFTLPAWVAAKGGWEWAGIPEAFAKYAEVAVTNFSDVKDWITLNEPMVLLGAGYLKGFFPPGKIKPIEELVPPLLGMLKAHASAYKALHLLGRKDIRVGVAHHLRVFDPDWFWNPLDIYAARIADRVWNWTFPMAIETGRLQFAIPTKVKLDEEIPGLKGTEDFFGVNYYSRDMISLNPFASEKIQVKVKAGAPVSNLGWEIYPDGMYRTLGAIHDHVPAKAILVTENGIDDNKDEKRPSFIIEHLKQIHRALSEGIPVEAYCYWSLMDNFEWAEGYTPRFGLYNVDYKTEQRSPRPSAIWFSQTAKENGFSF